MIHDWPGAEARLRRPAIRGARRRAATAPAATPARSARRGRALRYPWGNSPASPPGRPASATSAWEPRRAASRTGGSARNPSWSRYTCDRDARRSPPPTSGRRYSLRRRRHRGLTLRLRWSRDSEPIQCAYRDPRVVCAEPNGTLTHRPAPGVRGSWRLKTADASGKVPAQERYRTTPRQLCGVGIVFGSSGIGQESVVSAVIQEEFHWRPLRPHLTRQSLADRWRRHAVACAVVQLCRRGDAGDDLNRRHRCSVERNDGFHIVEPGGIQKRAASTGAEPQNSDAFRSDRVVLPKVVGTRTNVVEIVAWSPAGCGGLPSARHKPKAGGPRWDRTSDPLVKSQVLYH
jgi:hypothetical protein